MVSNAPTSPTGGNINEEDTDSSSDDSDDLYSASVTSADLSGIVDQEAIDIYSAAVETLEVGDHISFNSGVLRNSGKIESFNSITGMPQIAHDTWHPSNSNPLSTHIVLKTSSDYDYRFSKYGKRCDEYKFLQIKSDKQILSPLAVAHHEMQRLLERSVVDVREEFNAPKPQRCNFHTMNSNVNPSKLFDHYIQHNDCVSSDTCTVCSKLLVDIKQDHSGILFYSCKCVDAMNLPLYCHVCFRTKVAPLSEKRQRKKTSKEIT